MGLSRGIPELATCYTLSRLKGIETMTPDPANTNVTIPTCYTLSRLKGIETRFFGLTMIVQGFLAIHFPV